MNANFSGISKRGMFLLAGTTAAAAVATALFPRIAQPQSYHDFADARGFLGIPNAANVLSNLSFLLVGAHGTRLLLGRAKARFVEANQHWPYVVFFSAVT